jgi:hypothetical protein
VLSDQMTAVLALLGAGQTERHEIGLSPRAASAAAAALGVDGISLGVGTGPEGIVLTWGRETTAVALEDAQFTLAQGGDVAAIGILAQRNIHQAEPLTP